MDAGGTRRGLTPLDILRMRVSPLLALPLALAASGCQTMMIKQMQAAPIENRLYLHKGYKAGDYALYQAMDGAMQVRLELVDVKPGAVEVQLTFPKAPVHLGFMTSVVRRMFLNEKGEVTRAFVQDRFGAPHELRVAGPGDPNHIGELKDVPLGPRQTIRTPSGDVPVAQVLIYEVEARNFAISQKVTTALFLDPSVRFCLVRRVDVYQNRLPALELYQKALSLAPVPNAAKTLYDFILSRIEGAKPWEMSLLASH